MVATIIRPMPDPEAVPSTASRVVAWTGAALFVLSLGYFLYTYIVTFGETPPASDTPAWRAAGWNAALFGAFAAHHSAFARTPLRRWMAAHVSPRLERSVYVWIASLLLVAVCALWAPLPGVAWTMTGPWRWIVRIPLVAGIWLSLRSAGIIDVWELAGSRQLATTPNLELPTAKGDARRESGNERWTFRSDGPYGLVRHPIYLGWILVVFSVPTMTMTRLAFAAISCLYLVLAIPFEERTIIASAGESYREYMRRVRARLIPGVW
jgi:methanethiol S-methyltransferase